MKFDEIYNEILKVIEEANDLIWKEKVVLQLSDKNIDTFRKLRRETGITLKDFEEEVLEAIKKLKASNYYQGSDLDYNTERNFIFWKFGTQIFKKEIYLKFSIQEKNNDKIIIIWSCHFPEYKINYPFKE